LLNIFIDADACPVKDEVFRVAERFKLGVTLVSNMHMRIPESTRVRLVTVDKGPDEADNWIAEKAEEGDIVITADIPLASRCITKGAVVISPSGRLFTEDNIGGILATRNLMADLRDLGEITGGPAPFTKRDRSNFLQQLDGLIHSILRRFQSQ
jgi:uncharacterized protein YaiI (UPF0178 family)